MKLLFILYKARRWVFGWLFATPFCWKHGYDIGFRGSQYLFTCYCKHKDLDWLSNFGSKEMDSKMCSECGCFVNNPHKTEERLTLHTIEKVWRRDRTITENGVVEMVSNALKSDKDIESIRNQRCDHDLKSFNRMYDACVELHSLSQKEDE